MKHVKKFISWKTTTKALNRTLDRIVRENAELRKENAYLIELNDKLMECISGKKEEVDEHED